MTLGEAKLQASRDLQVTFPPLCVPFFGSNYSLELQNIAGQILSLLCLHLGVHRLAEI